MEKPCVSLPINWNINIFSLKKTVKRTDAFVSRQSGAGSHYTRQADPPVGDLLTDCVNAMPQENVFTRHSKRYATIGGRNDKKVSFKAIKGRNGQYGRSVDNISKLTEQIANQRFFQSIFCLLSKVYASCKNCLLCLLLILLSLSSKVLNHDLNDMLLSVSWEGGAPTPP